MSEITFMDDFEFIGGKITAKRCRDYQVHDDYVQCRKCQARRPADRMMFSTFHLGPVCIDHKCPMCGGFIAAD
jgi:hypothetical protein